MKRVLTKGTEIYYSGDMCNENGFGVVTKSFSNRFGDFVDISMDDGRKMDGLSITSFSPSYKGHGGTRFVTVEAFRAYHEAVAMGRV